MDRIANVAAGGEEKAPIIIKKINKGGEGHHGGAWKVAYADFVTAMMAFFLLLWLLNVTTAEQKMGIADYFSPASASKQTSGAGGVLGGTTVTVSGSLANSSSPAGLTVPVPTLQGAANSEEQTEDMQESSSGKPTEQDATGKGAGEKEGGWTAIDTVNGMAKLAAAGETASADKNRDGKVDEKELREALAKHEQTQFAKAEAELRQAIQQIPELRDLAKNLVIENTPEGLRIQLIDQEGYSMFPSASAKMLPQTAQLLSQVAQVVAKLPNKLSISGHTDSTPFSAGSSYGNWELSTDRANASRRALEASGVANDRFESVVGRSDRDHLFKDDPNSPRNRRISIVLLRENPLRGQVPAGGPAGAGQGAASPAPAANPPPARPGVTPAPSAVGTSR
ncbi:flagellar motor protein MotB [Niveispirillum sp. BGYR6]|uniref:flagellar motor protein MotB n=1 Tax=Niveispirillum sp. BGYR6 TaxID=2971249 RepID=UPI0022B9900B|nr:flagellar motor protein MotB [Niveispirillum sp. BGYR6]MDG5494309.1 flagellar motor protein MotB [Niveispirillum sp. BGYR6]